MKTASQPKDRFTILLPVYNGATHLPGQLESIAAQKDTHWRLLASDDGSTDNSRDILRDFAARLPEQVRIFDGPRNGLTAQITMLLDAVPEGDGPIALCDQDDLWFEDRLLADRALMEEFDTSRPALLCRRTELCDGTGETLGLSPARPRPPAFGNALVQNIASGNTMVINRKLLEVLRSMAPVASNCIYHDWWIYQIATGIGGQVHFDETPKMFYRQHADNLVGVPRGGAGLVRRAKRLLASGGAADASSHLEALAAVRKQLTPEAQAQLARFQMTRCGRPVERVNSIIKSGVYRQSPKETFFLWLAAFGGRI